MGGCGAGSGDAGVGAGTEGGGEDIDAWGGKFRLDLTAPAETAAGVDVDAVFCVIIGTDCDWILGVSGASNDRVRIGTEETDGVRNQ